MSGAAEVHSLEAIESVKNVLVAFADHVDQATMVLDAEVRRVIDWIEHDRPQFWKMQLHQAHDAVEVARAELHRCLMFPIADERPSCYDERKALKRAQARLAYCEEKSERVRECVREVQREEFEYSARVNKLKRLTDEDIASAVEVLNRLIQRLEEYQQVGPKHGMEVYDGSKLARELFDETDTKQKKKKQKTTKKTEK